MKITFIPTCEEAKFFPPIPVKQTVPDWYKDMSMTHNNEKPTARKLINLDFGATISTGKKCIPVLDYLTSGYAIRTFSEILISPVTDDGLKSFYWKTPIAHQRDAVSFHPNWQMPQEFNGEMHNYIKFFLGWRIRTPPGYSCLFYQNFYASENRFRLMPAIVDTDQYDDEIGFIGYLTTDEDFKIDAGFPMMTVLPFKRDEWKMDVRPEVEENLKTKIMLKTYFENAYKNLFHSKKIFK